MPRFSVCDSALYHDRWLHVQGMQSSGLLGLFLVYTVLADCLSTKDFLNFNFIKNIFWLLVKLLKTILIIILIKNILFRKFQQMWLAKAIRLHSVAVSVHCLQQPPSYKPLFEQWRCSLSFDGSSNALTQKAVIRTLFCNFLFLFYFTLLKI